MLSILLKIISILALTHVGFAAWIQFGVAVHDPATASGAPDRLVVESPCGNWSQEVVLESRRLPAGELWLSSPLVPPPWLTDGRLRVTVCRAEVSQSLWILYDPRAASQYLFTLDSRGAPPEPASLKPVPVAGPNPFNAATRITLALAGPATVKLVVYDVQGRQTAQLADATLPAGSHQWGFDGSGLASGPYFLHYSVTPGPSGVLRLLLLK